MRHRDSPGHHSPPNLAPTPNPHHNSPMQLRAAILLALTLALATACTAEDAPVASTEPAPSTSPTAFPTPATPSAVPTLATPTPQPLPADGPYGGVLVLANRGDPPSGFDTMRTSSIALHHVGGALFGPGNLVMRCRGNLYIACPYLAATWTVDPAFTEWTFTLRNDVFWHDGTPFTAEDVEFWFDLALNGYEVDGKVRAPATSRVTSARSPASRPSLTTASASSSESAIAFSSMSLRTPA